MSPQRSADSRQESALVFDVHIDEVVLYGFRPQDRRAIGEALARELVAVWSRPDALAAFTESRELDRLETRAVQLQAGAPANTIGQHVARAIDGGLRQ